MIDKKINYYFELQNKEPQNIEVKILFYHEVHKEYKN